MAEVRTISATGGEKGEKLERYDLIPVDGWAELARVFGYGATKYDDRNWERGYEWHKSHAALLRHVQAFWGGESIDPESGLHHLAHAMAHCLFLMQFEQHHPQYDDRSQLTKVEDMPPLMVLDTAAVPSLRVVSVTDCSECGHGRMWHPPRGGGWRSGKLNERRGPCIVRDCTCSKYQEFK